MHTLKQHLEMPKLQATYRFQLMSCVQKPGETLTEYVTELQDLGANCNFGDHLRDRLVSGANLPTAVRTHSLRHPEMTFEEMGQYAQNAELLDEQTRMYAQNLKLQQVAIAAVQSVPPGRSANGFNNTQQ